MERPGAKEYLLIKEEVRKVLSKGKAAGVLRLVFHDAGTFDMDDNTGMHLSDIISQKCCLLLDGPFSFLS